MRRRTWQRCVIGIESGSYKSETFEIVGARWRRRLVKKKMCGKDKISYKEEKRVRSHFGPILRPRVTMLF